jgi:tetratricopeptide (TPR) repeat protein
MWRAFLLAALVVPTSAFGQENSSWIGKRVITHYGAVLQIGNQVVDDEKRSTNLAVSGTDKRNFRVYRVDQVNGNWLWLKAEKEGTEGWVKAEFVIPYDQAIDYLTNQIRANPNQGEWYNRRGNVWDERGEHDIAIADYNEAIRLKTDKGAAFNNRGRAWQSKKEYNKAIADYNEAIRLDPKYAVAYINRGNAWNDKKDYDKAIADYDEAIRLDPNHSDAYINRGVVWSNKTDYDKAIADYNEAIRLDPKYAIAFNNRGLAWQNKKDYDKAIADYNEAIRLDPKDIDAYYKRGLAWGHKRDYAKAVANFNEAIRLDSEYANAFNERAWLWATCPDPRFRDGKQAVESAKRACELTKYEKAEWVDTLAAAYAEAGDFARAADWQEKANKTLPEEHRKGGAERLNLYKERKPYREEPGK